MQVNEITTDRLRHLADLRPAEAHVLTLYLNLDPAAFGTAPARASAIRSLLDEAARRVDDAEDLLHDERTALREDLARVEAFFADDFSADGAHGLAIFCAGPADLFEVVRLPRPVDQRVVIDDSPYIAPLARLGTPDRWAVLLASRSAGRLLRGSADGFPEVEALDENVHGQHKQGGWSQARYERSVDREAGEHIERVCEALLRSFTRRRFDRLLVGASDETYAFVESHLAPELRERFAGRVATDVADASVEDVHAAALPLIEKADRDHERERLDLLAEALGRDGRAAAGLEAVLDALVQRRVESLLIADGFSAPGVFCPRCGWMGVAGERCPVDGDLVDQREDIVESTVESAVLQSAEVLFVHHHDDLGPLGGIAAVLRF